MRSAYKLQFSDNEDMKKVGMKHDMTREERVRDAELRKEAKAKTLEPGNENFQFLVRGPVWDRKIIRIKKAKQAGIGEVLEGLGAA